MRTSWRRLPIPTLRIPPVQRVLRLLPNGITVTRIVLTPIFVAIFLASPHGAPAWTAGIVFGVAGVTDQIDGWLARRWQVESAFGAVADPLADKLIIGSAVVLLVADGRLPVLALILLGARMVALWLPRLFMLRQRDLVAILLRFRASWLGRASALLLYVALACIVVTGRGTVWPLVLFWAGVAFALGEIGLYLFTPRRASVLAELRS